MATAALLALGWTFVVVTQSINPLYGGTKSSLLGEIYTHVTRIDPATINRSVLVVVHAEGAGPASRGIGTRHDYNNGVAFVISDAIHNSASSQ
jgi:hypothetical protein